MDGSVDFSYPLDGSRESVNLEFEPAGIAQAPT